jgi:hypothetical protein
MMYWIFVKNYRKIKWIINVLQTIICWFSMAIYGVVNYENRDKLCFIFVMTAKK